MFDGERPRFAKHIDPFCVGSDGVEHRATHEVNVVVGRTIKVVGHDVRAEKSDIVRKLTRDASESLFVFDSQPVTGLDFDRRCSLCSHFRDSRGEQFAQLRVGGGPGGRDGRIDSPRRIGDTVHSRFKLGASVARENEVGVRVNKAGDDRPPFAVDDVVRAPVIGLCVRTNPRDDSGIKLNGGVVNDTELASPRGVVSDEFPNVAKERGHCESLGVDFPHRDPQTAFPRDFLGAFVTRVDVAHDSRTGVIDEDSGHFLRCQIGSIDDEHLSAVD